MNKAFSEILEKLEELQNEKEIGSHKVIVKEAKEIVQEVAEEYNNGWISCSERLPEIGQKVILQDYYGNISLEKMKIDNGLKGFYDGFWWASANNYIAWQPLPAKYQPEGE